MPYISSDARRYLMQRSFGAVHVGELNYIITRLVQEYLGANPGYSDFNDVLGVLTAVQFELYRRLVAPYEDAKCAENGDVF